MYYINSFKSMYEILSKHKKIPVEPISNPIFEFNKTLNNYQHFNLDR